MRKKPHGLYWASALVEVGKSGGNILGCISIWDQSQQLCDADQLKRPKRDAVLNLVGHMPPVILDIAFEHVDDVGDFSLSGC